MIRAGPDCFRAEVRVKPKELTEAAKSFHWKGLTDKIEALNYAVDAPFSITYSLLGNFATVGV